MSARVEYSITTVIRARELREAGWTLDRVADFVERETGNRPSRSCVHAWTSPEEQRRKLERSRARHRRESALGGGQRGRLGQAHHTSDYQEARFRALVDSGMLVSQAARVMRFDYPAQGWTYNRARALAGQRKVAA